MHKGSERDVFTAFIRTSVTNANNIRIEPSGKSELLLLTQMGKFTNIKQLIHVDHYNNYNLGVTGMTIDAVSSFVAFLFRTHKGLSHITSNFSSVASSGISCLYVRSARYENTRAISRCRSCRFRFRLQVCT